MNRHAVVALLALSLIAACSRGEPEAQAPALGYTGTPDLYQNETPELRALIEHHAETKQVPVELVQRVILRESHHRPRARNGPYQGLMQIHPQTARTMGYDGNPEGLLDPDTNLRYATRYLRGAWMLADGSHEEAVKWYARGYYYEARRRGMLEATGLR